MRTIRVQLESQVDATTRLTLSTEAIVGDDDQAEDAGTDARIALDAFIAGYAGEQL